MKKYLLEQENTSKPINAPINELDILTKPPFNRVKGQLQNIQITTQGIPKPIIVDGKVYTAGIRTSKGYYVVYDGRVLKKKSSGNGYEYLLKNGNIGTIPGSNDQNINNIYLNLLKQIGINDVSDIYNQLNQTYTSLQNLINGGALSDSFQPFNQILANFYPNDTNKRLKPKSGQEPFNVLYDKEKMSYYREESLKRFGLSGTYFMPPESQADLVSSKITELTQDGCVKILGEYLVAAIDSKTGINDFLNNEGRTRYKKNIKACKIKGYYDNFKFNEQTLAGEEGLQVTRKLSPYGFLKQNLNYNQIKRYIEKKFSTNWKLLEESKSINDQVKKTLNEQLTKQKRLVTERKIVENRLKILAESYNLKKYKFLTENQKTKLSFLILKEMSFLSKKNLINEQFADFLKNIFGTLLPSGIETIAERVVNSILGSLGLKDTYFRKVLVSALTTNPSELISALKDCKSLTKVVAKSLAEGMAMQLQDSLNVGGGGYDYLRNILGDVLLDQPVIASFEDKISGKICELYNKFTGKSKSVLDKLGGGSAAQLAQ